MIFQAILSNKTHPEYGVATIPFPILSNQCDHIIELLEAMSIGDATAQDCRVDELTSGYPILNQLIAQSVNLDKLNYLAKRLESFRKGEGVQFQTMTSKCALRIGKIQTQGAQRFRAAYTEVSLIKGRKFLPKTCAKI